MNKEEICKNCKYHYIEEISFDYPQSCCNKEEINHTTEQWCNCNDFEYSKEYTINLQKQLEDIRNYIKQSDLEKMLWGKELMKILDREE